MKINFYGTIYNMTGNDSHTKQLSNAIFRKNPHVYLESTEPARYDIQLTKNEEIMLSNDFYKDGVSIAIALPDKWPGFLTKNPKHFVGFFIWEGDRVPKEWLSILDSNKVDQIWVPSNHTKKAIINTYSKLKEKIRIVPHGVNLELFKPKKEAVTHDRITFIANKGWLRGLHDRGGLQYLFKAFSEEFDKKESDRVSLKVKINTSYDILNWDLNKQIEELNLDEDRVDFDISTKMIDFEDLPDFYYSGDVFVSPSMCESFGLTMAEAMACGLPCITTNFGGQTEFINENNSWLIDYKLVPSHQTMYRGINWALPDLNHLKKTMRFCVENPNEVNKKGLQAVKDITKFNWDNSASKALEFLEELAT